MSFNMSDYVHIVWCPYNRRHQCYCLVFTVYIEQLKGVNISADFGQLNVCDTFHAKWIGLTAVHRKIHLNDQNITSE